MASIENRTGLGETCFLAEDENGRDCLVVCLAGHFILPSPGSDSSPLRRAEEQPAPPLTDVYFDEPGRSSLSVAEQTAFYRPGCDVYVFGHACAPGQRPVASVIAGVTIGPIARRLLVHGDRFWSGVASLRPSSPKPFVRLPLRWEHSFGGTSADGTLQEPRNPIGRGFYVTRREAQDRPLPNIEDPDRPIVDWNDRPPPAGFGPIARSWQPRLTFAGSYDNTWRRDRMPSWPEDLDLRYFQAAAPGLSTTRHLKGGESVRLDGLHPAGSIMFLLPTLSLVARSYFRDHSDRRALNLDGVSIDADRREVVIFWRATIPVHGIMHQHRCTVIREREPWEPA
jgi:hypothetical protein